MHPLPPLLHNQPQKIAGEVRRLAETLAPSYGSVVVGYADCGTYGALDEVCRDLGLRAAAGPALLRRVRRGVPAASGSSTSSPGTYLLTDFLVRSFARTVLQELGLDRWPELRDTYFGHYTRVVWLAQEPDDELRALAQEAADRIGLPLTVVETGDAGLERALAALVRIGPGTTSPRSVNLRSGRPDHLPCFGEPLSRGDGGDASAPVPPPPDASRAAPPGRS